MNCKPNELAVIVRDPKSLRFPRVAGRVVTCLWIAPSFDFRLPDGQWNDGAPSLSWVVEFPHPINMPLTDGRIRATRYAVAEDAYLRPIRPGDITDEEVRELYAPKQPEVA